MLVVGVGVWGVDCGTVVMSLRVLCTSVIARVVIECRGFDTFALFSLFFFFFFFLFFFFAFFAFFFFCFFAFFAFLD